MKISDKLLDHWLMNKANLNMDSRLVESKRPRTFNYSFKPTRYKRPGEDSDIYTDTDWLAWLEADGKNSLKENAVDENKNESLNEDTNWREIKTALDNNKINTVKAKIDKIILEGCRKIGCIGYFYKKKYKDDCLSLLYSFHMPEDDTSSAIYEYDDKLDKELAKKLRISLKPILTNILSTIPEVNKVGFVKGYNWGEVVGYIKIPYANLVLDKNNVPTLVKTSKEQDDIDYDGYTSTSDYYDELKSFGYDPESDF